ncbi:MAG: CoA transferase [Chloroflexi bacterium]|nr:CoA transferase [Chloroflexota bacterium]
MAAPLDGIKVVDWTIYQQGPVASLMLGDLGADVIKIEHRVTGDPGRGFTGIMGLPPSAIGDRNFYFETNNRNKRSLTVDVKKGKGREIVYKLVSQSDVFIHNFRQGVPEKVGLGYEELTRINPRLVYGCASGFGPEGPEYQRPSFDAVGLARTGYLDICGVPDMPPQYPPGGLADQMGATMLAYGVLAALLARERLGVAQKVDVSHIASMAWLQNLIISQFLITGKPPPRHRRERAANPMSNYYKCGDGKWIFLSFMQPDRHWPAFCRCVGLEHLEKDPRFADSPARRKNREDLIHILDNLFAQRPAAEWAARLSQGRDLVYEVVNCIPDLLNDPQVQANKYIVEIDHPTWGPTRMVNVPVTLSKTPGEIKRPAPEFGQHTEEILQEIGYSWEEITGLREAEVI